MLYNRLFCLLRWDSAGGHQHNDVCGYVPIRQKVWARLVGFWNCDACSRYDTLVHTCKSARIHTCTRTHAGTHSHTQAQARTARTHTNIQYNPTLPSQTPPPFRHLSGRCRAICGSERKRVSQDGNIAKGISTNDVSRVLILEDIVFLLTAASVRF